MEIENKILNAARDLRYLLNRGYNKKSAIKLVGDRYILDKNDRHVLYRAIFSDKEVENRKIKALSPDQLKNRILTIDGYNVLITLETMLKDKTLIKSNDGFYRDASKISNRYKKSEITVQVISLIFKKLVKFSPKQVNFFFDKPISKSGEIAALFDKMISEFGLKGTAETVKSPDQEILKKGEVVISADSVLLDKGKSIFDLAGSIINEQSYEKILSFEKLH